MSFCISHALVRKSHMFLRFVEKEYYKYANTLVTAKSCQEGPVHGGDLSPVVRRILRIKQVKKEMKRGSTGSVVAVSFDRPAC